MSSAFCAPPAKVWGRWRKTSLGHRPDFDETALFALFVFALDDDERSVPYPRFQQGDNLGLVRLDVQLHGCRNSMAGPFLRLGVFPPAAGGYGALHRAKIGRRDVVGRGLIEAAERDPGLRRDHLQVAAGV